VGFVLVEAQYLDAILGDGQPATPSEPADDREALDAYSRTVTGVAERLIPSVASLRVSRRFAGRHQAEGAGSAVAITPDGFLLTSAHVVAETDRGSASFADGREFDLEIVGTDPLSDLAVVRAAGSSLQPVTLGDASVLRVGRSSSRSGTRLVSPVRSPRGW
jgi:serine protease Do